MALVKWSATSKVAKQYSGRVLGVPGIWYDTTPLRAPLPSSRTRTLLRGCDGLEATLRTRADARRLAEFHARLLLGPTPEIR